MKRNLLGLILALLAVVSCLNAVTLPGAPTNQILYPSKPNEYIIQRGTFADFKCKTANADTILLSTPSGYTLDRVIIMQRDSAYTGTDSGFVTVDLQVLGNNGWYAGTNSDVQTTAGRATIIKKLAPGESVCFSLTDKLPSGGIAYGYRIITNKGENFQSTDSVKCVREYIIGYRLLQWLWEY